MTYPGLREIVASVVREIVLDVDNETAQSDRPTEAVDAKSVGSHLSSQFSAEVPAHQPTDSQPGKVERVKIASDEDLNIFVRKLLHMYENPKNRQDLRSGRLTFSLIGAARETSGTGTAYRIETGAVTERKVAETAAAGHALVLGSGAVLTPLGREKARRLGVQITKER